MVEKAHFGDIFSSFKAGDLHTHTSFSRGSLIFDGALTPQQLVEKAESLRYDILAITDHDTIVPSIVGREFAEKERRKMPAEGRVFSLV